MDIVDQLNDYYTTRSKSCRSVMVVLSCMLDTARVNRKTVWCLKNDSDISSTSTYHFSWNFEKAWLFYMHNKEVWMTWHPACSWKKFFSWNSAFSRWATPESREKIHRNCIKKKMSITHGQLPHKDRKGQCPKINWTVPIMWYQSLQEHSMPVCHGCLQLNFILHFIFIVLSFSFKL